jgi:UDP-N-acetylmuramate dehydrogenase
VQVTAFSLGNGSTRDYGLEDFKFAYRHNLFLKPDEIVLSAEWNVTSADPAAVKAKIDETLARRKATQPVDYPSCGSVFKNPPGEKSWAIIDKLGLRGHRIGDAQIAEKHSNFIINLGAARAADVRALIELAQRRAREELGITLEEEVMYLGKL